MCEFCHQHGEGKKWYLAASNYAGELFNAAARQSMSAVLGALGTTPQTEAFEMSPAQLTMFRMAPRLTRWIVRRQRQKIHWGQVVPLEDAIQVLDMMDWVVRLPCACRSATIGDRNARYCLGIGLAPLEEPVKQHLSQILDPALSLDTLSKGEAQRLVGELYHAGAVHSVWTFNSPFIGGLCNCDQDCMAFQGQVRWKLPIFFRAEYVAQVDAECCTGCRQCMSRCQFGAINYSLTHERSSINPAACYGCGVCRAVCPHEAITLVPRQGVPVAASHWDL